MIGLLPRAVFAFVALPGIVAFLVPLTWLRPRAPVHFDMLGAIPLCLGTAVLLSCVREFYVAGCGTLAPWAPPTRLVTTGLYRFSRNPMYVGVILILCGWAGGFRSGPLALYAAAVTAMFHLRILLGEEPWLARTHGQDWVRYRASVPRWLGRRHVHLQGEEHE